MEKKKNDKIMEKKTTDAIDEEEDPDIADFMSKFAKYIDVPMTNEEYNKVMDEMIAYGYSHSKK